MQINVCTMKQTAKDLFAKSSAFVELSVCKSDSYVEFTKKAAEALDIPHTIGQLKLFKVKDGIIILDHEIESGGVSHAWTIGL